MNRLILALLAAAAGPCQGANALYVVAPDGSDAARGDAVQPLRSLREAVRRVQPGDTIELRAGRYDGAVVISTPGRADAWIRMRARAGEKVVIQGDGPGPALYFYHRSCDEAEAQRDTQCTPLHWEVEGLEIIGSPDGQGDGNAVKIDTPQVRLVRNDLWGSRADVVKLVRTANDVSLLANRIHHPRAQPGANAQGVDIVGADRVRVAWNHVHDIPSIGVYAKGNAREAVFEHNLVERTWSHALMLGQQTDADRLIDGRFETYDGIIRDNLVVGAGWSCLATSSSSHVLIEHNTCIDTGLEQHGSVLLSNESEVKQPGERIRITDNVFVTKSRLPMIRVTRDALADPGTLLVDRNHYGSTVGSWLVSFSWPDRALSNVSFDTWKRGTGQDEASSTLAVPLRADGRGLAGPAPAGRGTRGTPGPAGYEAATAPPAASAGTPFDAAASAASKPPPRPRRDP